MNLKKITILLALTVCSCIQAFPGNPPREVTLNINKGWNLLSSTQNIKVADIKDSVICNIYTFRNNQYVRMEKGMTINNLEGFWLYSPQTTSIEIPGEIGLPTSYKTGWNLVGYNESSGIPADERAFYWNFVEGAYANPLELKPGRGYWFFNMNGPLDVIPGPPGPPGVALLSQTLEISMANLAWLESDEILLLKSSISKSDVGLGNLKNIDTTNASNLTAGTVHAARLPVIPLEKIPSGIPASKITGLPDGVDITNISGDYITSGTVSTSRLNIQQIAEAMGFTDAGFEPPKMTTNQRLSVPPNKVEGRLIYDTDVKALMRGNEAGMWIKL